MPSHSLNIWNNAKFPADESGRLAQGIGKHRLILASTMTNSNLEVGAGDPGARNADVMLGQPHLDDIIASTSLKWIHLTSAGYTRYDRDDVRAALKRRGAFLTNSSRVYADPCAQHLLSFMLARSRKLMEAHGDQINRRGWVYQQLRRRCEVLTGQSALIVGFGSIGRRLVELLAPFGMNIVAVRRSVRADEPVKTIASSQIDTYLPQADHIINVLPSGGTSTQFFDACRLARLKSTATFYNVGRGDTVDHLALVEALNAGRIAAAFLDVTSPEPLPADDPLWRASNCYITPHLAGGYQDELRRQVDHFLANLARFDAGEPLFDRIM